MLNTDELPKETCEVDGKRMAYVELGEGPPIVFFHGNPASSYIWRNIMPIVAPHGRCIAPDLIGMGDSEKLDGDDPMRYGFLQHRRFVEGLLKIIGATENVVLVGQDWGGALAMDWRVVTRSQSAELSTSRQSCVPAVGMRWTSPLGICLNAYVRRKVRRWSFVTICSSRGRSPRGFCGACQMRRWRYIVVPTLILARIGVLP
jgi:alpha/beta hydrolase fold